MPLTVQHARGSRKPRLKAIGWGMPLLGVALLALACEGSFNPVDVEPPEVEPPEGPPIAPSPDMSVVTVSSETIEVGESVTVALQVRDADGNDLSITGLAVAFTASGGTSQGSFGSTADQGDGRYEATYTGTAAGTPTTIGATMDGVAVESELPTVQVVAQPPQVSPAMSVVTVSSSEISVGQSTTVTLQARDAQGNNVAVADLTVSFAASGGTSQGSFGSTSYQGGGRYRATFTGTTAGSPTTIGATINGAAVTSSLPTVQVVAPPPEVSTAMSVVTVGSSEILVGQATTATLQARDADGNNVAVEGLTVAFTASGGSSQGSFGSTSYHGGGQYRATFTGTAAGSPTTIGATINGATVTSSLPTIQVVSPPPPPPGDPICEATGSARCWYVNASAPSGGNGDFGSPYRRPQDAVTRANPGDFIYLRGGADYTHNHAFTNNQGSFLAYIAGAGVAHGEPARPITLASYPGEQAVIRGQFSGGVPTAERLGVRVWQSYWHVRGLRLYNGGLSIGANSAAGNGLSVRGVRLEANHLSDYYCSIGNCGAITIGGQPAGQAPESQIVHELDPADIHIIGNTVHTVWGIQQDGSGPLPWNQDADVEHHACFAAFKWYRDIYVRDNTFRECAAAIYFKWVSPGPMFIENNTFGPTRVFGRSRAEDVRCSGNSVSVQIATTFPYSAVCD